MPASVSSNGGGEFRITTARAADLPAASGDLRRWRSTAGPL
ncbi:hypothetical protein AAIH25_16520 [Arthrobacter crystallopoietes]